MLHRGCEEGEILNPAMDTPEVRADLAAVRRRELDRATAIIGYDEVVMLGYRDSGMAGSEANAHPDCFAAAPLDEAVGAPGGGVRRTRPQVMVIYGDDQSGYPHPDHLRVHDAGLAAFRAAGDPARFPGAGPAHQPAKLYYTVHSAARFRAIHDKFEELGLESPFDEEWRGRWDTMPEEAPTAVVDITGTPTCGAGPAGPRHPGRPEVEVLVRAAPRGDGRPSSPTTTTGWPWWRPRRHGAARRERDGSSRTTCSPASRAGRRAR